MSKLMISWAANMPKTLKLGDLGWKSTDSLLLVLIQAVEKNLEMHLSKHLQPTKRER